MLQLFSSPKSSAVLYTYWLLYCTGRREEHVLRPGSVFSVPLGLLTTYLSPKGLVPEEVGRASFTVIIVTYMEPTKTYGEVYKKQDVLLHFLAK